MRCWSPQVVFQEVPDHISLAFTVSGCPLECEGCHSKDTWPVESGEALTNDQFIEYLRQYRGLVSCVVFFGGEWWPDSLIEKLKIARAMGLSTCLYSGFENAPKRIKAHLDFIKLGPWRADLGGLTQASTNQRFYDLNSGECLNYRFSSSPTSPLPQSQTPNPLDFSPITTINS